MLNICVKNAEQEQMVASFMELQKASYQKRLADCKSWELRLDHEAFTAYQPERQKAFESRNQKRQEAYALVKQNPELAADLIERLINQIHEEC